MRKDKCFSNLSSSGFGGGERLLWHSSGPGWKYWGMPQVAFAFLIWNSDVLVLQDAQCGMAKAMPWVCHFLTETYRKNPWPAVPCSLLCGNAWYSHHERQCPEPVLCVPEVSSLSTAALAALSAQRDGAVFTPQAEPLSSPRTQMEEPMFEHHSDIPFRCQYGNLGKVLRMFKYIIIINVFERKQEQSFVAALLLAWYWLSTSNSCVALGPGIDCRH